LPFKVAIRMKCALVLWTGILIVSGWASDAGKPLSQSLRPLFEDTVLAVGPGFEVMESEVEERFIAYIAMLAAKGETLPELVRLGVKQELLRKIIHTHLLIARATPEDRADAKQVGDEILAQNRKEAGSDRAFRLAVHAQGLRIPQFEREVAERSLCEQVVNRDLRDQVKITDTLTRQYYIEHSEEFRIPESARIRHLFMPDTSQRGRPLNPEELTRQRSRMESIRKRLQLKEDFEQLEKEVATSLAARLRNGEFIIQRGEMPPEIDAVTFALFPGQVSDVITTTHGFHVIQLMEKTNTRKISIEEVRGEIIQRLTVMEVERRLPDYLAKLTKDSGVRLLADPRP